MTEPSGNPELLNCPFCGLEPKFVIDGLENGNFHPYRIECPPCGIQTHWSHYKDAIIESWNKRVKPEIEIIIETVGVGG